MAIGETGVTGAHGQTVQYPVEGETEEEEGRDNVATQNLSTGKLNFVIDMRMRKGAKCYLVTAAVAAAVLVSH